MALVRREAPKPMSNAESLLSAESRVALERPTGR
jgi:hypothetical protein